MVNAPKQSRRIGRPPAGARAGEKVKDYPQLSIRLPAEVKAKLQALSVISGRPQWRLITDSIDCFLRERPEAEQRMVEELVGRSRSRSAQEDERTADLHRDRRRFRDRPRPADKCETSRRVRARSTTLMYPPLCLTMP